MILEAMYNWEFYPCETVVPTSPEYRKAVIACEKLMEQLSQRLSNQDKFQAHISKFTHPEIHLCFPILLAE